jgi:hypothetical protein
MAFSFFRRISLLSVALLFAGQAHAALTGANIDITASNGFASGSNVCKNASVLGASVGAGLELTAGGWSGGCVGYYSADVSGDQLVLQGLQWGNYTFATLNIHVNSGAAINDVLFGGYTENFFDAGQPKNDANFLPNITFDANDIWITWDTLDSSEFAFNGPDNGGREPFGTASFRISTTQAIPEPATLALMGLGLAGLGFSRRKSAR